MSPITRFTYHHRLRQLLRELATLGTPANLDTFVPRVPKPAPREVTATDQERTAVLAGAHPPLRLLLLLCSDLALRRSTALKLAPCHYDPETRTIATRTKADRVIQLPVTTEVSNLFELCPHTADSSTPYVALLRGAPYGQGSSWREFAALKLKLRITRRLTFHDLRRTTAHRTYELTHDLRLVQALLGHQHLNSTLHYLDHRLTPVQRSTLEAAKTKAGVQ